MRFSILDKNVDLTMNIFLIIANIINLIYNVPQVIKTYKTKSTKDFSGWFISLRIVGNVIWIAYAVEVDSLLMLINNIVTVLSSFVIGYYMILDMFNKYKNKYKNKYNSFDNNNYNNNIKLDRLDELDELDRLDKLERLERLGGEELDVNNNIKLDRTSNLNKLDKLERLERLGGEELER